MFDTREDLLYFQPVGTFVDYSHPDWTSREYPPSSNTAWGHEKWTALISATAQSIFLIYGGGDNNIMESKYRMCKNAPKVNGYSAGCQNTLLKACISMGPGAEYMSNYSISSGMPPENLTKYILNAPPS